MTEIKTYDYILCPYCQKKLTIIQHTHLKTHGKTTKQFKEEFPDYPFRCGRLDEAAKKGAHKNKENKNKMKDACCVCGDWKGQVGIFETATPYRDCCKAKGIPNPDGRSNGQGEKHRKENLQKKYGAGVINAAHIDGVTEKTRKTNLERYGGTGFASDKLKRKGIKTMIEKGYFDED